MWTWLEKIVGTYEKPLVLTNEVKPKRAKKKKAVKKKPRKKKRKVKKDPYNEPWNGIV